MRYLFLILSVLLLQSCFKNDPEKYELKSPCVAADNPEHSGAPCQRRPVNNWLG
jgi:hypothetical protein